MTPYGLHKISSSTIVFHIDSMKCFLSTLKRFLKDHVTLKIKVKAAEILFVLYFMKFYKIIYPCLDHKQTESKEQHIADNIENT